MSFWSFMRDMMLFDWLFGHRRDESSPSQSHRSNRPLADYPPTDDYDDDDNGYDDNDDVSPDLDDDF